MATLITWTDRGVSGPRPSHHRDRSKADQGPVMRLVSQPQSRDRYDHAIVLTTKAGRKPAADLVNDLKRSIASVEVRVVDLPDPSDYERVFAVSRQIVAELRNEQDIDVLLSAGTPQMQATWVVMVKSGLLEARMLQVIPAAFVPDPHPKPIKVVNLDFDGFPEIIALRHEVERLRAEVDTGDSDLIGSSDAMRTLRRLIGRVAASDVSVVVYGETGTGKELAAKAIHRASRRAQGPFVTVNCAAFSESVLQSELFGHEKGAFTGAHNQRRGLFEQAHGGTLFLDEVGELSPRVQASLLRVLQEGTLRRLGGENEVDVDVRVIAATHRNLKKMIQDGQFREDLYYRLRGTELEVPSLRERPGDIGQLVKRFLSDLSEPPKVSERVHRLLQRYRWPGNVRELRAEVVRWSVFGGSVIRPADLSSEIGGNPARRQNDVVDQDETKPLKETVRQAEETAIRRALDEHTGNISRTARALQIDRNTLKKKMEQMGLRS